MSFKNLLTLFTFACFHNCLATHPNPELPSMERETIRIVGGVPAAAGEFPFMVSLQRGTSHFCGGSLIHKNWVLTAAHCVRGTSASSLKLRIGMLKQGNLSGVESLAVKKIVVHPQYNSSRSEYDFALLQLNGDSNFQPVTLNSKDLDIPDEENQAPLSTTLGWGRTSEGGSLSSTLMKVEVPLVSSKRCESAYPGQFGKTMVCAGLEKGGKDSCQGDSGGPLVVSTELGEKVLVGVVSWGEGCARPKKYGVYAEVNSALSWIENQLSGPIF